MHFDRRKFLRASGSFAAVTATGSTLSHAATGMPFLITRPADVLLPKSDRQRVVICGGGWGGLNAAKQLRLLAPHPGGESQLHGAVTACRSLVP